MKMKVQLVSTFQPGIVVLVSCHLWSHLWALIFSQCLAHSPFECLVLDVRRLVVKKKARFCGPSNHPLGLASPLVLATTWLCLSKTPCSVIFDLLSSRYPGHDRDPLCFLMRGSPSSAITKKKKGYYYQPNNMTSVSNLIYRMKKMQWGLRLLPSSTICW